MIRKSSVYHMLQIGLVLSQFVPGTLPTVNAAQLVYENTLESGWGDVKFIGYEDATQPPACQFGVKFRLVSDPAGSGSQVAMLTQPGDDSCLVPAPDNKHRAIIGLTKGDGWWLKPGVETWIGYRIYIPSDYPTDPEDVITMSARRFGGGEHTTGYAMLVKSGSTVAMRVEQVYTDASGALIKGPRVSVDLNKGAWNDIIIRVKWVNNTTGYYEFYHNGSRKINWQNIITAGDPTVFTGDLKLDIGIYWATLMRAGTYRIYYDNIRVATGADGFGLVNPGNGSTPPAAPPATPTNLKLISN